MPTAWRRPLLFVGLPVLATTLALAATAGPPSAEAQRRRRPANLSMADTRTEWTLFVSPFHDAPSTRGAVPNTAGAIALPAVAGWSCRYGDPVRTALDGLNWSERRSIECRHGEAFVSTDGFCQIAGPAWAARAAVISIGPNDEDRLQMTLECAVLPAAPATPPAR